MEKCFYYTSETSASYIAYEAKKRAVSKKPLKNIAVEILMSYTVSQYFNQIYKHRDWRIGFPVKNIYVSKFEKGLTRTSLEDFKRNLEKNIFDTDTFTDFSIREYKNKKLLDLQYDFQLKRFGIKSHQSTAEELIKYIDGFKQNASTHHILLIFLSHYALTSKIDLHTVWDYTSSLIDFPFSAIWVMSLDYEESPGILVHHMYHLYPTYVSPVRGKLLAIYRFRINSNVMAWDAEKLPMP